MNAPLLISATGTPLTDRECLHVEGLRQHLDDQWTHGINGVLIAGTMGLLQLLTDQTYRDLVRRSVEFSARRGEHKIARGFADCLLIEQGGALALQITIACAAALGIGELDRGSSQVDVADLDAP